MVTDGKFKLIYYPIIEKTLLFDLKADPNERNNLADDPEYAERVKDLWKDLLLLQKETGDRLHLDGKQH